MDPISKEAILAELRSEKPFLAEKYGVISIGLFGSYAKLEEGTESDIDLIVELRSPKFDWLAGLQVYLESKFKKRIELIRKSNSINRRFINRIEKDVIYV